MKSFAQDSWRIIVMKTACTNYCVINSFCLTKKLYVWLCFQIGETDMKLFHKFPCYFLSFYPLKENALKIIHTLFFSLCSCNFLTKVFWSVKLTIWSNFLLFCKTTVKNNCLQYFDSGFSLHTFCCCCWCLLCCQLTN